MPPRLPTIDAGGGPFSLRQMPVSTSYFGSTFGGNLGTTGTVCLFFVFVFFYCVDVDMLFLSFRLLGVWRIAIFFGMTICAVTRTHLQ